MSRYIAYVGSHTDTNTCKGLTAYDVNVEEGSLKKKGEYSSSNATYITASYDHRFLYSITDNGIASFRIRPDGSLKKLNTAPIRGMRGCHICLNRANTYLFVSSFFDGKLTVLHINPDGSVGKISDSVFHKGPGSIAERNYRPHIRCSALSPDENFLFVTDSGLDQIKIYRFRPETGTLMNVDTIHCRLQAGPRYIRFTRDGQFFYTLKELTNTLSVFRYTPGERAPQCEYLGTLSTLGRKHSDYSAAAAFCFSEDEKYVFCTNAGDNSVGIFSRDAGTGLLTMKNVLPISGTYPTSVQIFPDEKHIFCTNHDSDSITFFTIDFEKGLLVMSHPPLSVPQPSSSLILELPEES